MAEESFCKLITQPYPSTINLLNCTFSIFASNYLNKEQQLVNKEIREDQSILKF